ncbi:uncharacterized protein LOC119631511 [Glossina fuscipes]|uniref:Uncharacterized protein LOC119631511 n=2 Tax=Nemorhina TaxID=44051 RepID=A0A8U0W3L7_9MUSC|nr:uncharacterized protein LOC119631511 [Glossina fuscipes]KAI9589713.1 hypothetical protein GQX74_007881 [Glossina fuscipes]
MNMMGNYCCTFSLIYVTLMICVLGSPVPRHYDEVNVIKENEISTVRKGRVFPGATAIKKLILLKLKKVLPISLILLRSNERNEEELVPVYTTDNIPNNAHFIPTPNGISNYKDVQAVAVPNIFHQELVLHGMDNLESFASLLDEVEEDNNSKGESTLIVAEAATNNDSDEEDGDNAYNINDEVLNKPENANMELNRSYDDFYATWTENRKTLPHPIEEIPIYLYTIVDANQAMESRHQMKSENDKRRKFFRIEN